jgi:hypothetical protein
MRLYFRPRLIYVSTIGLLIMNASAIALLVLSGGCAISARSNNDDRRGYDLHVYKLFDNSRDWGPSYLVGPPGRHFGYGARVDDRRSATIDEPVSPPDFEAPVPTLPLPVLP